MPPQDGEFNEVENLADMDDIDEGTESGRKKPPQQDKGSMSPESRRGRPKFPEELLHEYVVGDLPVLSKVCTCCQSMLFEMGESTCDKLVYLPDKLYV